MIGASYENDCCADYQREVDRLTAAAKLDQAMIEKLLAERDRLRALLEEIAIECDPDDSPWNNPEAGRNHIWEITRQALANEQKP